MAALLLHRLLAAGAVALLLVGCKSSGPRRVAPDSFDYNQAITTASNEQMLLNLVRLRYGEVPSFLAVNTVLTQYVYSGRVSAGASSGDVTGFATWGVQGSATGIYIERPTITYAPLTGRDFAEQLLQPIPSDLLFSLVQSGWPARDLLVMSLERINDLENTPFAAVDTGEPPGAYQRFEQAVELLLDIARREGLEMRQGESSHVLVFDDAADDETSRRIDEFREMLGLAAGVWSFRVTDRVVDRDDDEITLRMRSMLALMGFLARGIDVPAEHGADGRAGTPTGGATVPVRIRADAERPEDAFVAVRYADHWFSIARSDRQSKQAFGLLSYLFQLQAPRSERSGPVLTVPTG